MTEIAVEDERLFVSVWAEERFWVTASGFYLQMHV